MDSPELIPIVFLVSFTGYYFRTIWRVHRDNDPSESRSLAQTWLKHWHRPEVSKSALRCAARSLGVFLGIEIAEDDTPKIADPGDPEETDHY